MTESEPPVVPHRPIDPAEAEQRASFALRTFAQRPMVVDLEALRRWQPDVAIIGAPYDLAVTNRPGARFGPSGVRNQSYFSGTYHLSWGIDVFEWLEVVDGGDVSIPHGQPERAHANIRQRVKDIAGLGIIPIIVGGDHSIAWPNGTALADVHGYGRIGMVHFDAHADTADTIEGNLASHGTPMRRLIESGAVPGRNFVQIGLRSHWPEADTWDWMREQGLGWFLMDDVVERGLPAIVEEAIAIATDGCDLVYLSIDIDSLDPAFAPGTGTPEVGGLTTVQLLRAVRQVVSATTVVGMDICEVSPPYDHADLTVNAAHHLIMEALAAMAARKRTAAGVAPGPPVGPG